MNMSYCRFQNTRTDLRDCAGSLEEMLTQPEEELSRDELEAAKDLVSQALNILHLFADHTGKEIGDIEEGDINSALDGANAEAHRYQNQTVEENGDPYETDSVHGKNANK